VDNHAEAAFTLLLHANLLGKYSHWFGFANVSQLGLVDTWTNYIKKHQTLNVGFS
jgi:hypothetical protein